jgi:hypothetical protein
MAGKRFISAIPTATSWKLSLPACGAFIDQAGSEASGRFP